eukprot:TRINITY_DN45290_c0_g1_i1.p3 TRINITY_DN45290_c0_g1~~TRINITY_DN45290_c0_g1_i1.p3  ORF type:complete len:141 (+),score=23.43 TRINITY_DN45290_c0_g1_i1:55-477(+)
MQSSLCAVLLVACVACGLHAAMSPALAADAANFQAYGIAVRVQGRHWPSFGELLVSPSASTIVFTEQKQRPGTEEVESAREAVVRHPSCERVVREAAAACGGPYAGDALPARYANLFANLCIATGGRSPRILEAVAATCA